MKLLFKEGFEVVVSPPPPPWPTAVNCYLRSHYQNRDLNTEPKSRRESGKSPQLGWQKRGSWGKDKKDALCICWVICIMNIKEIKAVLYVLIKHVSENALESPVSKGSIEINVWMWMDCISGGCFPRLPVSVTKYLFTPGGLPTSFPGNLAYRKESTMARFLSRGLA